MGFSEEYYCPRCNAILNDQYGFDPDEGVWTCTECGYTLYGDGIYEGERFPGVMWRCDSCDALLNKQSGFSDSYSTWTCTECGHVNGISEDDVYETEDDYRNSKEDDSSSEEYDYSNYWHENRLSGEDDSSPEDRYCPHCYALLNIQDDFDPDDEDWICEECGKRISDDDDDDDISDYSHSSDYTYERRNEAYRTAGSSQGTRTPAASSRPTLSREVVMFIIYSVIAVILIVLFVLVAIEIFFTDTPESARRCLDQNYLIVEKQFRDAGFDNITVIPIEDLSDSWFTDRTSEIDTVQSISIDGNTAFKKDERYRTNAAVTIYYHVYPPEE